MKYDGEVEFEYWISGEDLPLFESFGNGIETGAWEAYITLCGAAVLLLCLVVCISKKFCCKNKGVSPEEFELAKNPNGMTLTESNIANDLEIKSVHGSDGNATMNEPVDPATMQSISKQSKDSKNKEL